MSVSLNAVLAPDATDGFTIPSEQRDFPDWHQGRPVFAVWAIAVEDAAVVTRLRDLREALGGLLLPGCERQPHVTLQICGFPAAMATRHDDFTMAHLSAHVDALAAERPEPFNLSIGDAFSFASAACLAVHDDAGTLLRCRAAWQRAAPGSDCTPYVPHVTAGLYANAWPLMQVQNRLLSMQSLRRLPLRVRCLDWMAYDSRRIGGPLHTLLRVDLASGEVQVPDATRLRTAFAAVTAKTETEGPEPCFP